MTSTTIPEAARTLRAAIQTYDEGHPPTYKNGNLLPGAEKELAAVDPVMEAALDLLDRLSDHGYVDPQVRK